MCELTGKLEPANIWPAKTKGVVDIKSQQPHVAVVMLDSHNGRKIANLLREAGMSRVDFLRSRDLPTVWMNVDVLICCRVAALNARKAGFRGRLIAVLTELPTPQVSTELESVKVDSHLISRGFDWVAELAKAI